MHPFLQFSVFIQELLLKEHGIYMHLINFLLALFFHTLGHEFVLIRHTVLNKYLVDTPNITSEI